MKRILCILMCLFAFSLTAFAEQAELKNNEEVYSLKLNYPIVTMADEEVSNEINRFIAKKMYAYKKVYEKRNYLYGNVDYKVMYEDDDYLSMVFEFAWYYKNAAHGMYNKSGIVFDKHTGKLVNLKQFVPELSVKNLSKKIYDGELQIYNAIFEPITLMDPWMLDRVSHSYYIDEDKTVYLIYQPYELAPYAMGNTYIKITQEDAKKLKE